MLQGSHESLYCQCMLLSTYSYLIILVVLTLVLTTVRKEHKINNVKRVENISSHVKCA